MHYSEDSATAILTHGTRLMRVIVCDIISWHTASCDIHALVVYASVFVPDAMVVWWTDAVAVAPLYSREIPNSSDLEEVVGEWSEEAASAPSEAGWLAALSCVIN